MDTGLAEVAFWAAAAVLVYAYGGYPLSLAILRRRPRVYAQGFEPSVSVIVAAHNEERDIAVKIANVFAQGYPADRVELIVVSDGSTDATERIVAGHRHADVRLVILQGHQGKNAALNAGAAIARGEILVFTDANATFAAGALARLVCPFQDPRVGLVSGQGLYLTSNADGAGVSNAYVRYEAFVKRAEASLGFLAAADGAFYAMRRSLHAGLSASQVHDLVHPIQAALAGYSSAFVPEAVTLEPASPAGSDEWGRHLRIAAQGLVAIGGQVGPLLRARRLKELWMLVSHRLLRWTSSFWLALALTTNAGLVNRRSVYAVTLAAQLMFYMIAALGAAGDRLHVRIGLLAVPYYFCVVSLAGLRGLIDCLRGHDHAVWARAGRGSTT